MAHRAHWCNVSDDLVVIAALAGMLDAWEEVVSRFAPCVRALARRWAPDFTPDDIEDVVAEVWAELAAKAPDAFDPERGTVVNFLTGVVRTGVQRVWSALGPVGLPQKLPAFAARAAAPYPLSLESEAEDGGGAAPGPVLVAVAAHWGRNVAARLDAKLDLERLIVAAPPDVATALGLMHGEGLTLEEAATAVGLSRFALRRQLDVLADRFREPVESELAVAA